MEEELIQQQEDMDTLFPSLIGDQDVSNPFHPSEIDSIMTSHVVEIPLSNDVEFDWEIDKTMLEIAVYKNAKMVANPMGSIYYKPNKHGQATPIFKR